MTPEEIADLESAVHEMCNRTRKLWLGKKTVFKEFKEGKIDQFKFHILGYPPPAQKTDIELFGAELHEWLDFNKFDPISGPGAARAAIRAQVQLKDDPMQALLDVVVANYQPRP